MRFILGRTGTGKSTKVLNEIKYEIEHGFDKPIIYIVPEQFSFEAEKKLIEITGKNGIIGAQVLSFKRLCYKAFTDNNLHFNNIAEPAEAMLIYSIMSKLEKKLLLLNGGAKNAGIINTIVDEIAEFKRYSIDSVAIRNVDFKNEYLNRKIHDVTLILEEYQKAINDKYIDNNDSLTILADVLKRNPDYLAGAKIWIDEFDGFIPQEMSIIKELDAKCDVTVSITSGEDDIFELNNSNIQKLKDLAINSNTQTEDTNKDNDFHCKNTVRYISPELRHLEQNIFKYPFDKYNDDINDIYITSYNNLHEEVEGVAKEIIKILRANNETRFSNIAILTKDLDNYKNVFKLIFPLYGIPYFVDDKRNLAQEPLMTLIQSFFDIVSNNYRYEDIFSYLKTGLTNIADENDIDLIENYVLKWGIKGKRWEEDFTIEDVNLEKINNTRAQIVSPIIEFKSNFSGRKTVKEIVEALFKFILSINVYENLQNKIKKLIHSEVNEEIRFANEYSQVWNLLIDIFDDMVLVLGDEQVSFDRFKQIFKIGISNQDVSVIPSTKDEIIIGDIERTRNSQIDYLFVIGVNDGSFPKSFSSEGFLTDSERELLSQNGFEIAKDTKNLLKLEFYNIYKSFSMPKQKLYISYPTSDLEGKTKRMSLIVNQIKAIFPNIHSLNKDEIVISKNATFPTLLLKLREKADNEAIEPYWMDIKKWYELNDKERFENTIKGLSYKNTIEYQDKIISKALYGEKMNSSVSRLENYKLCPFSFYLRYGIRLKEREIFKLGVPDIGSFLHEIIELFSKKVLDENIDIRTLEKIECDKMVDIISESVIKDFRNNLFLSTGKLKNLSLKLKAQVKKMVWLIIEQLKAGNFEIMGSEVEFGKGKEYPEIVIELEDGNKLILSRKS